ncbi:PRC-barrel domain-containing protein [Geodermatophilus sp. SYSU D01186]
MSAFDLPGRLVRLSNSDRKVADPETDVRGRTALDSNGERIGTVEELLVDEEAERVRFLCIGSAGFLGIGRKHLRVPVDAVTTVGRDIVIVTLDRDRLLDVPGYDPQLARDRDHYAGVHGGWSHGPYWSPGFTPPPPYRT